MNQERLMTVLLGPIVSEKSTRIADKSRTIAMKVALSANKIEVKEAVEKLFNVKVECVNITTVKGKVKRFANRLGRRSDWKKAYVTLEPGHDINFAGVE